MSANMLVASLLVLFSVYLASFPGSPSARRKQRKAGRGLGTRLLSEGMLVKQLYAEIELFRIFKALTLLVNILYTFISAYASLP